MWLFLLYLLIQKNPTVALFLLGLFLFYKYMARKKSAERILAKKLSETNRILNQLTGKLSYLREIAKKTDDGLQSSTEEKVHEDLGIAPEQVGNHREVAEISEFRS